MKAATLALSAAGLILVMGFTAGCNKGADPNGPGNKSKAMTMKPSAGSAGQQPTGNSGTRSEGSANAGPKE